MSGFYGQSTPFEQNSNAGQGQQQPPAYGSYGGGGSQAQPNQQASGYGGYSAGGWAGTSGAGDQQQQQQQQGGGGYRGQSQSTQQQSQSQSSWEQTGGWQSQSVPSTSSAIPTAPAAPMPAAAPQQQAQPSSIFNPAATVMAAAVSGNNDAMMKAATDVGQQFLKEGTARLIPGLDLFMRTLRVYFAVDNRYVKTKIGRLLFPFTKRNWARMVRGVVYMLSRSVANNMSGYGFGASFFWSVGIGWTQDIFTRRLCAFFAVFLTYNSTISLFPF